MRGKRRDPRQDYAGVYYILNTKNSRIYVGQSVRIFDRQDTHRSQLTHGTHPNKAMLADWRAFGPDVFEFGVLVTLPGSTSRLYINRYLLNLEQIFMRVYQSRIPTHGYNIISERKDKLARTDVSIFGPIF
jgi:hypothetical protein